MERHEQIREDMKWRETRTYQGGHKLERDMNRYGRTLAGERHEQTRVGH